MVTNITTCRRLSDHRERRSSPNYTITFIGGTLTVMSPPIVTIANVEEVMKNKQVIEVLVTFRGPVNAT